MLAVHLERGMDLLIRVLGMTLNYLLREAPVIDCTSGERYGSLNKSSGYDA